MGIGDWLRDLRGRVRRRDSAAEDEPGFPGDPIGPPPPTPVVRRFDEDAEPARGRIGRALEGATARLRAIPRVPALSRLSVGVLIESGAIRLLACEGRRVDSWATIPFDPQLVVDGKVRDPYALGRIVDNAFNMRQLPRHRVHVAMSGHNTIARILETPRIGTYTGRRSVPSQAQRELGISPSRFQIYWQTIDVQDGYSATFVLAVPRDYLGATLGTLEAAELQPHSVGVKPLALGRAVGEPDAIVADLESTGYNVVVVAEDIPVLIKTSSFGDRGHTLEQAQDALVDELARSLRRYEQVNLGAGLDRTVPIFLTGELAGGLRLADRVRYATGHPIGRLAPPFDYPPAFPVHEFAANLGVLMRELP